VPRTLAENAGLDAANIVAALYAAHKAGKNNAGINVVDARVRAATASRVDAHARGWFLESPIGRADWPVLVAQARVIGQHKPDYPRCSCFPSQVDADTGVLDLLWTKKEAIRQATDAAVTVLRVDQIIMAKPAGGAKKADQPAM